MIGLFDNLIDAFREQMAAVWPELPANGIWEAEEALTRSFETQLALPYGVIDVAQFPPSNRDGIRNRAWRPTFALYYISEVEGDSSALRQKMEALADYMDTNPLAVGQVIPPNVNIACGRDLEPNALLILLNATQRAGQVSGTVAVGVTR